MGVRLLTQVLAAIAFILLLVAFFVHGDQDMLLKIENFGSTYQAILTSIGTLVLVIALTVITTNLSNKSASDREIANRRVSTEIKIVEFRQVWINDLRNDFSEFLSIAGNPQDHEMVTRLHLLAVRIHLRLNPDEKTTFTLMENITNVLSAISEKDRNALSEASSQLQGSASALLKGEWNRLKRDLKAAQISVGQ
jgi:hypothetical protein